MNILLAAPHSHTRLGLEMLLNREPGVSIAGSVGNGASLLALARTTNPDIIILADTLPGLPAAELIARLRGHLPTIQVILLCTDTADGVCHSAGATICVTRSAYPVVLLTAFRSLRNSAAQTGQQDHLPRR